LFEDGGVVGGVVGVPGALMIGIGPDGGLPPSPIADWTSCFSVSVSGFPANHFPSAVTINPLSNPAASNRPVTNLTQAGFVVGGASVIDGS